ncbi:adenylyltransferase/cytidyltransferase family protein [Rhodoferax sp.]|uniref:adenylyltransferase/cytidyltransferase family protein n=1 Tax=Rhodoferax sp. TaxID=50421 RepID=UPI00344DE118
MGFRSLSELACVHGRFQPFHLGHVDYLKACLERWDAVVVGIAAPTPVPLSFPGVEHRNRPSANPLTYLERTILIRECCRELGIEDRRIEFSPFPIDEPSLLNFFIPKTVVCATTRLYAWNDEKIRRLTNEGYSAVVLDNCKKVPFNGSRIRSLMVNSDNSWTEMVTPRVGQMLDDWQLADRIRVLLAAEDDVQPLVQPDPLRQAP